MDIDARHCRAAPRLLALGAALLLAGCTVGPAFRAPENAAPGAWMPESLAPATTTASGVTSARPYDGRRWWAIFGDPVLDALVDDAARQNLDLQSTGLRIAEARAQRDAAAGAALPSIAGNGVAGRSRMSENGITSTLGSSGSPGGSSGGAGSSSSAAPSLTTNLFQVGFDAVWELDLWGKTRRSVEAADAMVQAAELQRGDAAVSLTAEVARDYITLRGLERRREVQQAEIIDEQRQLALVDSSARSGLVPKADVVQQSAQLAAALSQLPSLEQNIAQARHRLELLLAVPPGALRERLATTHANDPTLPPEVPIGLPGELLRRRPDVMRSEAELHAATARVGVAEAQLFPTVQLGAVAGFQATRAGDLTDWASRFFLGGAQVSMPLFQGGRLKAQVSVSDVQLQEALLTYRQTVLSAFHDAENALVAYTQERRRTEALARQLGAAQRSRELARSRYRSGLSAFSEVLQIDRNAHDSELALVQSRVTASTNLVALYKALGGDWGVSVDSPGLSSAGSK